MDAIVVRKTLVSQSLVCREQKCVCQIEFLCVVSMDCELLVCKNMYTEAVVDDEPRNVSSVERGCSPQTTLCHESLSRGFRLSVRGFGSFTTPKLPRRSPDHVFLPLRTLKLPRKHLSVRDACRRSHSTELREVAIQSARPAALCSEAARPTTKAPLDRDARLHARRAQSSMAVGCKAEIGTLYHVGSEA